MADASTSSGGEITINIQVPKGGRQQVSIAPTSTIRQLKEKVSEVVEDCPADRQRLIYSGRVLKDDDTVASYKIAANQTLHLVKSNAPAPETQAPRVPEQLQAGQQVAGNPLAPLMNATHPGLGGINPFANMGVNQNDPNMWQNMMQTPEFQRQMQTMLSDPAIIDQLIAQSPELRALGPQARVIMQSPMFREMLTNPQAMQFAAQAAQARGMGPFGGAGGAAGGQGAAQPGLFGLAQQQQQQQQAGGALPGAGASPTPGAMPDFSQLFGANSPFGQLPTGTGAQGQTGAPAPNFNALMNMFGGPGAGGLGGFGGLGGMGANAGAGAAGGQAGAAAGGPSPEERFSDELAQLAGMGFVNARQNIRALLATGGNVEHAVTFLLEGGGLD